MALLVAADRLAAQATTPGIITAVAGLITPIGTLIAVFVRANRASASRES